MNTMPMKNPVHPGRIVRHDCLEPLGLSVTAGAKILGVTRQALNNIVNGKSGISPEMAIRLTKAFGSTEETWLRMQLAYDLAAARKNESKIKVKRQHVPKEFARALTRKRFNVFAALSHTASRIEAQARFTFSSRAASATASSRSRLGSMILD